MFSTTNGEVVMQSEKPSSWRFRFGQRAVAALSLRSRSKSRPRAGSANGVERISKKPGEQKEASKGPMLPSKEAFAKHCWNSGSTMEPQSPSRFSDASIDTLTLSATSSSGCSSPRYTVEDEPQVEFPDLAPVMPMMESRAAALPARPLSVSNQYMETGQLPAARKWLTQSTASAKKYNINYFGRPSKPRPGIRYYEPCPPLSGIHRQAARPDPIL